MATKARMATREKMATKKKTVTREKTAIKISNNLNQHKPRNKATQRKERRM